MNDLLLSFLLDVTSAYDTASSSRISAYVSSHTMEEYLLDVQRFLAHMDQKSLPKGELMTLLADILVHEAGPFLEDGDLSHFDPHHPSLAKAFVHLKESFTPHTLAGMIQALLSSAYPDSSITVIQTPYPLEQKARVSMRRSLAGAFPHAFPTFSVDRALLGGLRIFVNGTLCDNSWQYKVKRMLRTLS